MDTHALFWLLDGSHLEAAARVAIAEAQESGGMHVSAVSAWEAAVAITKRSNRPNLVGLDAADWFRVVLRLPGVRLIGLPRRIALEAASVPAISGWGDPFDCLLIATARVKKLPIITRDRNINRLAHRRPDYVQTIVC
jgi:PIN domain nuclease of toxin-antitoxin system